MAAAAMKAAQKAAAKSAAGAGDGSVEEIDTRKGNLRAELDEQQLKTFTRWWNSWLAPRGTEVTSLCEQICSGVIGFQLLEALDGTSSRYNKSPVHRVQIYENHANFIAAVKAKGLRLVNISSEDLASRDVKLVLGLTYQLIQRFEIHRYGADELELLRWVKQTTESYEGVEVTTWFESFNDGRILCALLDAFVPESLSYADVAALSPQQALTTAFDVAHSALDVPHLLEATDLVDQATGKPIRADDKVGAAGSRTRASCSPPQP